MEKLGRCHELFQVRPTLDQRPGINKNVVNPKDQNSEYTKSQANQKNLI